MHFLGKLLGNGSSVWNFNFSFFLECSSLFPSLSGVSFVVRDLSKFLFFVHIFLVALDLCGLFYKKLGHLTDSKFFFFVVWRKMVKRLGIVCIIDFFHN